MVFFECGDAAVDLVVAQDVAGSFLYEIVFLGQGFLSGSTVGARVQDLWSRIRKKYIAFNTPNQLQKLSSEMIVKKKKHAKPQLKTKGAEMRNLVPILLEIAK